MHVGIISESAKKRFSRHCVRKDNVIKYTNSGDNYIEFRWKLNVGPSFVEGDIVKMTYDS